MNSINNYIGQKLGLCPLPSIPPPGRDRKLPLNQKIAEFLYYNSGFNIEAFWEDTLSNDKVFYQLVCWGEWDLAREFYYENRHIDFSYAEDSTGNTSSLSIVMAGIKKQMEGHSQKGDPYKLLELIFERDDFTDLFLKMAWPDKQALNFLVQTNQLKFVHRFIEKLIRRGEWKDIEQVKKIFISIKDLVENKRANGRNTNEHAACSSFNNDVYEEGLQMWGVYLTLMKETYREVFSEIEFNNESVDSSAKSINYLVARGALPSEIYEKIALRALINGGEAYLSSEDGHSPYESALLKNLIDAQEGLVKLLPFKYILAPKVLKETLVKLTTLSFLAFQENSKVVLNDKQKKQCFRLIDRAIFKNGSIFNSEIKERIVREIGSLDHFSQINIEKALERAFN